MNIHRLNVGSIIYNDNEDIECYTTQKCLYGIIEIPLIF